MNSYRHAYSAALIAGGKSTRMGEDKARLIIEGRPLWERQLEKLRLLQPAELLVSGPSDGPWAACGIVSVPDAQPGSGPLGGLAALLAQMHHDQLLVLAVDLPAMTTDFLARLMAQCRDGRGVVPLLHETFEPLAAVYPRAMLGEVQAALLGSDLSLQRVLRAGIDSGHLDTLVVAEKERALFRNLNTPVDLAALRGSSPHP